MAKKKSARQKYKEGDPMNNSKGNHSVQSKSKNRANNKGRGGRPKGS